MLACGRFEAVRHPDHYDLEQELLSSSLDVLVDFTTPDAVMDNARTAIRCKVRPVIGTTGLGPCRHR